MVPKEIFAYDNAKIRKFGKLFASVKRNKLIWSKKLSFYVLLAIVENDKAKFSTKVNGPSQADLLEQCLHSIGSQFTGSTNPGNVQNRIYSPKVNYNHSTFVANTLKLEGDNYKSHYQKIIIKLQFII